MVQFWPFIIFHFQAYLLLIFRRIYDHFSGLLVGPFGWKIAPRVWRVGMGGLWMLIRGDNIQIWNRIYDILCHICHTCRPLLQWRPFMTLSFSGMRGILQIVFGWCNIPSSRPQATLAHTVIWVLLRIYFAFNIWNVFSWLAKPPSNVLCPDPPIADNRLLSEFRSRTCTSGAVSGCPEGRWWWACGIVHVKRWWGVFAGNVHVKEASFDVNRPTCIHHPPLRRSSWIGGNSFGFPCLGGYCWKLKTSWGWGVHYDLEI